MPDQTEHVLADVSPRVDIDALEREMLAYWEQERIFARTLEQSKDRELFTFYDGPPYATGKPHYGHILQSAIKDTVLRYKAMRGYYVPRRVGWDCHGLPVETLVEKELGFTSKKDIEAYGIEQFNQRCRETVFRYIDEFTATLKRMGRWADYDQAYATLDQDYIESEWWVFRQLWDQNLVYKDFRSTPFCIRCETPLSNFEVSMAYRDRVDQAVYVRLALQTASLPEELRETNRPVSLLVWTTTPWTLPANVAVAINPALTYVSVATDDGELILAQDRIEAVFGSLKPVVRTWTASELLALRYEPLFPAVASALDVTAPTLFSVVASDHDTATDGSGIVHMAPAFGEEDAQVAKRAGLPMLKTVAQDGTYYSEVPQWGGQHIFVANEQIVTDLRERSLLVKDESFTHSYPFCWRCDNPLIYYALDSWFVRVTAFKDELLAVNEQITWIPEHVKHGRFAKGIESAPDWAVSRNRYWSVPMPIWECDTCQTRVCVGSIAELQQLSGITTVLDLHRPHVDAVTWQCEAGDGTMRRIPEVLDVWFDSGSMPYSQWHYPFERKAFVEQGFPADFIAESIEMTRAWFYVLHVLATALTREDRGLGKLQPAYQNVIASGLIFAEDGQKLSKKLKNYPEIGPTLEKYGADVLRFYLLSSTSLGEPYRFSEKELQQVQRNIYLTWWNVYSFFTRYAKTHHWRASAVADQALTSVAYEPGAGHILDAWVVARVRQLHQAVTAAMDTYAIDAGARLFVDFIDDVSNWYVRRSRARFQKPGSAAEMQRVFDTLYRVLVEASQLLAPFMPFVSESMYRNLTGRDSVHLQQLAEPVVLTESETALLAWMERVRTLISEGLALRARAGIKVRQPLRRLFVRDLATAEVLWRDELVRIVCEELNVKQVEFAAEVPAGNFVESEGGSVFSLALDTEIDDALRAEGIAREIIRHGQQLRRQANYALDERITLVLRTQDERLQQLIAQQTPLILTALQADNLVSSADAIDATVDLKLLGAVVHLAVRRA